MIRPTRRATGFGLALTAGLLAAAAVTILPARGDDTPPTTRPAGSASRESRETTGALGFAAGRLRPGNAGVMRPGMNFDAPATPEEMRETEAFMKETFPVRYHFYEMMPEDRPAKKRIAQVMVQKYRQFRHMQETQPDAYEA